MAADPPFEEDSRYHSEDAAMTVVLDGYEGPVDLLLSLARQQKLDLARVSILALADQYLDFIARMRAVNLEIAGDYLVMAAWLAYLKSRLLLPAEDIVDDAESPEELAARFAWQLKALAAMQDASEALFARPQLGENFHRRGQMMASFTEPQYQYEAKLYDLLASYGALLARDEKPVGLRIIPTRLYSMELAIEQVEKLLGKTIDWADLLRFLPENLVDPLIRRSAVAAFFAASLELAREGKADLQQREAFGSLFIRAKPGA